MEFGIWQALLAGFAGVLAMMVGMRGAKAMGMTNMPPMPLIIGGMVTDEPDRAKKIGLLTHVVVMGAVVFGLGYAALFAAFGTAGWLSGVAIGAVHGLVVGVVFTMMGAMHPRMQPAAAFSGGTTWRHDGQHLEIEEPGFFGVNYGGGTAVGVVVLHALYGLVLGAVYNAVI